MKEKNENSAFDAEQLLRDKSWDQLNASELKVAQELFSGPAEYERMRSTAHRLRSSAGIVADEWIPAKHIREDLLIAFDDEQKRRRSLWLNSLVFWFRDRLRLDIPAVRYSVAMVVLLVGIFTLFRLFSGDVNNQVNIVASNNVKPDTSVRPGVVDSQSALVSTPQVVSKIDSLNDKEPMDQRKKARSNTTQPDPLTVTPSTIPTTAIVKSTPSSDSSSMVVGVNSGNDTLETPIAVTTLTGSGPALCCGSSSVFTTSPTANSTASYAWSSTVPITVNVSSVYAVSGQIVKARSLSNDEEVLDVFFTLQ